MLTDNKERELLFAGWLDEIRQDAAAIYLLGDIFDFWFEYRRVVPRGFTRVLGRMAACTDQGIPVHFFTGNHDQWVFDYLPAETGVTVHTGPVRAEFGGKKFFLAHGDGLDPRDKGYLFLKKVFNSRTLRWLFRWIHPDAALYLAHKWSETSRMAKKGTENQFHGEEEGIYQYALSILKNEQVDYFVFGHRHRLTNMELPGKSRFILLGEWIKTFSFGVFDGDTFSLEKYGPGKGETQST